jgi:hypothetical protein
MLPSIVKEDLGVEEFLEAEMTAKPERELGLSMW